MQYTEEDKTVTEKNGGRMKESGRQQRKRAVTEGQAPETDTANTD